MFWVVARCWTKPYSKQDLNLKPSENKMLPTHCTGRGSRFQQYKYTWVGV